MSQINVNKIISPDVALQGSPSIDIATTGNVTMDTNVLFVDATNDRTGVGTASPARTLDIAGSRGANFSGGLVIEKCNIVSAALTGTVNHDFQTSNAYYYSANPTGNWTYNVRFNSGNTLNSKINNDEHFCITYICPVAAGSYYHLNLQIDGATQTVEWQSEEAPSQGGGRPDDDAATAGFDVYFFDIIKTASATYTCFGTHSHFGAYS